MYLSIAMVFTFAHVTFSSRQHIVNQDASRPSRLYEINSMLVTIPCTRPCFSFVLLIVFTRSKQTPAYTYRIHHLAISWCLETGMAFAPVGRPLNNFVPFEIISIISVTSFLIQNLFFPIQFRHNYLLVIGTNWLPFLSLDQSTP